MLFFKCADCHQRTLRIFEVGELTLRCFSARRLGSSST